MAKKRVTTKRVPPKSGSKPDDGGKSTGSTDAGNAGKQKKSSWVKDNLKNILGMAGAAAAGGTIHQTIMGNATQAATNVVQDDYKKKVEYLGSQKRKFEEILLELRSNGYPITADRIVCLRAQLTDAERDDFMKHVTELGEKFVDGKLVSGLSDNSISRKFLVDLSNRYGDDIRAMKEYLLQSHFIGPHGGDWYENLARQSQATAESALNKASEALEENNRDLAGHMYRSGTMLNVAAFQSAVVLGIVLLVCVLLVITFK